MLLIVCVVLPPSGWAWAETPSGDSALFGRRPARVGDLVDQRVRMGLQLKTQARQGDTLAEQSSSDLLRHQHRVVSATEVAADGTVIGARVRFESASTQNNGQEIDEPVVGKTYLCRREGERLTITTERGELPPMGEYQAVARAMETLGKPNPLARYLAGKRLSVGQTVDLPKEVAVSALGMDEQMGEVERFRLRLEAIDSREAGPAARFAAEIEAAGGGSGQMRLRVAGRMTVDVATCQLLSADLVGPIGMVQTRGSLGHTQQLFTSGKLTLQTASRRQAARR